MVGYASTATFRSNAPPGEGDVYSDINKQAEAFNDIPGPPVVVFQDLDDPPAAATFGEVMCTTYQTCGAKGIVTSGAGRDLDQVRAIGFPAFTTGTICAHGDCHITAVHVPVHVGGITVYPGDLLHGDCNGVTTIPNEIAADVAHACADLVAAEEVALNYLKGGSVTPEGLADSRAECKRLIDELRARVAKK